MISYEVHGSFKNMEKFLLAMQKLDPLKIMDSCGREGANALAAATPRESGLAAESWGYQTSAQSGVYTITWTNRDIESGFPVAIMLQYGHGTGTGGYVSGRDYINPAIRPIFDKIADKLWKAVTSA
jgi:hypothetical protein